MTLSTDQLKFQPNATNTISEDRRSAVFAVLHKEFTTRRKPPDVMIQELLKAKSTARKKVAPKKMNYNEEKESHRHPKTHTTTHNAAAQPVVQGTKTIETAKATIPELIEQSTSRIQVAAIQKPPATKRHRNQAAKHKVNRISSNDAKNGTKRKSSRIEVKSFQSGSLLGLQPLSNQDKAAILKRKQPKTVTSDNYALLQLSKQQPVQTIQPPKKPCRRQHDDPPKPSSQTTVSRSVSPTTSTPRAIDDNWQTRVPIECCGGCTGCTTRFNCDRCEQCLLRTYAPPTQQSMLRCMHRICCAPTIALQTSGRVSVTERRPDPPMIANEGSTTLRQNMTQANISPPARLMKKPLVVEKAQLEP